MIKILRNRKVIFILFIILVGFLLPQKLIIPVEGATKNDWDEKTFWYYPWGNSITHKGVDIFGNENKNILASTSGLIIYKGKLGKGGNVLLILGSKWRLHYYAHLNKINVTFLQPIKKGKIIGKLGKTGNAANTPPHLHYSIITLFPYFWLIDNDKQGWMKMFFLNPLKYLK